MDDGGSSQPILSPYITHHTSHTADGKSTFPSTTSYYFFMLICDLKTLHVAQKLALDSSCVIIRRGELRTLMKYQCWTQSYQYMLIIWQ